VAALLTFLLNGYYYRVYSSNIGGREENSVRLVNTSLTSASESLVFSPPAGE
jgi:hypothetical protein